jgi:hypothetical protein
MNPLWDLLVYLGCIQIYLGLLLYSELFRTSFLNISSERLYLSFAASTVLFWLVWGGYSVDAWRYLARFDFSPLHFHEEQLFWIAGYLLNKVVVDPWPLKIISACSILILSTAYFKYNGKLHKRELIFSYMLLLVTPGYFLLIGNTVRQGLAGSIEILAAVYFLQQRFWIWIILAVVGFFVHQFGILVVLALALARLFKRYLLHIWVISFLASPVAAFVFQLYGYNLGETLRYGTYSEGALHWEKVLISGAISIVVLVSITLRSSPKVDFRHVYIGLITISNTVFIYEVPFERIFLFSDLAAPLALSSVFFQSAWLTNRYRVIGVAIIVASVLLWTNQSIIKALGFN